MAPSLEFQEENPFLLLDALYCEEEKWESDDDDDEEEECNNNDNDDKGGIFERNGIINNGGNGKTACLLPLLLLEQDLFWEDEEILGLFAKEKDEEEKQGNMNLSLNEFDEEITSSRKEAVEWIIKVNSYYGFCTLTCVLAVNYFDRFFATFQFQKDKPWMFQLAAVACLSLAAKVEETHVPLLLDLQVEVGKYMFEAKAVQKMELLVLSTLEWKMNPVTPLSFLDHIIRRLGLKNHLHWEFLRRCQGLLLSLLSDWRMVSYKASVLATATMMHVIDQIEPCNPLDYQNQLLGVLNISKEKVNDCYQLIVEKSSCGGSNNDRGRLKRTFDDMMMKMDHFPPPPPPPATYGNDTVLSSPSGVMDVYYLSCDSSNDSWDATTTTTTTTATTTTTTTTTQHTTMLGGSTSLSSSVTSSPVMNRKRSRVHEQLMPLQLPSLSRVFVDAVGSPH